MLPVRGGDSPPQQTGNAWSPSSVVLGVPGYITLTGRQLLSLLRMQMTHYLVQLPVLPLISSMSFYPKIPIIRITLDQRPTVSNSLPSMMIVILLTECFLDSCLYRPTRYVCVWLLSWLYFIHLTAVFVLFLLHAIVFFIYSRFIYSCVLSSVFYTINEWMSTSVDRWYDTHTLGNLSSRSLNMFINIIHVNMIKQTSIN